MKTTDKQSKTKEFVCHKCGKPATGRYSPDMDVAGLAFCDEHQELMAAAFYCLIKNDTETFNQLMGTDLRTDSSIG
jgi:hypothetical protein